MFRQLRLWVWVLWAAALVAAIVAAGRAHGEAAAPAVSRPSTTPSSRPSRTTAVNALASRILALQPHAPGAAKLASSLLRMGGAHSAALIAIAMQESSLLPQHRWYPDGSADLGVFQINSRTAMHYGCHLERLLLHDPEESVRCAARVLRDKRATCLGWGLSSEEATACYHSFTPRHRLKYMHALRRWS